MQESSLNVNVQSNIGFGASLATLGLHCILKSLDVLYGIMPLAGWGDSGLYFTTHQLLKNRSPMRTCGLLLSLIPFYWIVVFNCQYLGVELLQVRRQSLERLSCD